jgi:uncharacterized protein with PIN domain
MSKPVRHLHRDYSTSHCGKDISHLLATFDPEETTCKTCQQGLAKFQEEEEGARIEFERERAAAEARAAEEMKWRKQRHEERERQVAENAQRHEDRLSRIEAALGLKP